MLEFVHTDSIIKYPKPAQQTRLIYFEKKKKSLRKKNEQFCMLLGD